MKKLRLEVTKTPVHLQDKNATWKAVGDSPSHHKLPLPKETALQGHSSRQPARMPIWPVKPGPTTHFALPDDEPLPPDHEKLCQALIEDFIRDIEGYDEDKYRSELLAIREKNKALQMTTKPKDKPLFEYQSKKRLRTMSLLKSKVPPVKVEEKYLTKEEIYNQAKNLFKKRIDQQKEAARRMRNVTLQNVDVMDTPKYR